MAVGAGAQSRADPMVRPDAGTGGARQPQNADGRCHGRSQHGQRGLAAHPPDPDHGHPAPQGGLAATGRARPGRSVRGGQVPHGRAHGDGGGGPAAGREPGHHQPGRHPARRLEPAAGAGGPVGRGVLPRRRSGRSGRPAAGHVPPAGHLDRHARHRFHGPRPQPAWHPAGRVAACGLAARCYSHQRAQDLRIQGPELVVRHADQARRGRPPLAGAQGPVRPSTGRQRPGPQPPGAD